jgi:FkbM family methyltransferase
MTSIFLSRSDEERLLKEFLPRDGFFVDVGANDPVVGSQTWFLEQQGWRGLLVEPQPHFAERLWRERKSKVVQKACGERKDIGKVLPLTILGTNAALFPDRVFDRIDDDARTVDVEIDTLDNMLIGEGVDRVDYVSLDIEGYEVDALRGFDIAR